MGGQYFVSSDDSAMDLAKYYMLHGRGWVNHQKCYDFKYSNEHTVTDVTVYQAI